MDGVTNRRLRHAPCLQWSSAGNVIRNSTFHCSDMQWHAGGTNENLVENCTVDAGGPWGSYGFGGWASPPGDAAHGPQGPRNVVYDCDARSPKAGLWFGGAKSGWLILHSRFQVEWGPGIYATTGSRDHTVRGNTFILGDPGHPLLLLATADCTGVEVRDNRIIGGSGKLIEGAGGPVTGEGNVFLPPGDLGPRPDPAVSSILLWQRGQR